MRFRPPPPSRGDLLGNVSFLALMLAFAGAALIGALAQYERGYNRAIDPSGTVAQIFTETARPGQASLLLEGTLGDLAAAIRAAVPGAAVGRLAPSGDPRPIEIEGRPTAARITEADPEITQVLDFGESGDGVRRALARPDGAVVTQSAATALFGEGDALGRTFTLDGHSYVVRAAIGDFPDNSSLADDEVFVSLRGEWTTLGGFDRPGNALLLMIGAAQTFVRLPEDGPDLSGRVRAAADRHAAVAIRRFIAANPSASTLEMTLAHRPVPIRALDRAVALGAQRDQDRLAPSTLLIVSLLSLVVLVVAALNSSSLSTSRLIANAPAVAVRRAFGAPRARIAATILGGALAAALFAALAGFAVSQALNGWFASLLDRTIERLPDQTTLMTIALTALAVGLLGGLYPAYAANRFRPAEVLSARGVTMPGLRIVRPALVFLQVAASAATIAFATAVLLQLDLLTGSDLGFEPRSVYAFELPEPLAADDPRLRTIESRLSRLPGIGEVTAATVIPSEGALSQALVRRAGGTAVEASKARVSGGYFATLRVSPLAGRFHESAAVRRPSSAPGGETLERVVISANLVRALGFDGAQAAVGQILQGGDRGNFEIVGVAPDLPLGRIRADRKPFVLYAAAPDPARFVMLRVERGEETAPLAAAEEVMRAFFPNQPVDRFGLEERVATAFLDVSRMRGIVLFFSLLVTLTAIVGVLAMSIDRAQQMRGEAGVRKAFGAGRASIARMLVVRLLPPLVGGLGFGALAGIGLGQAWISQFGVRAEFVPASLSAAIVSIALAGLIAIFSEAYKLARLKPADTLREE